MAEGVKTMFRIAKKLEESFKLISFYSSRYLVKSSKYRGEYLNEYKKITGKMKKDSKKDRIREKQKYKAEREKLKLELLKVKQKKERDQKERHRHHSTDQKHSRPSDRPDRDRSIEGGIDRDRDRREQQIQKSRDRDRERHRQRHRQKHQEKDRQDRQKERQYRQHAQRVRERDEYRKRKQQRQRDRQNSMEKSIARSDRQASKKEKARRHDYEQVKETKQNKFDIFDSFGQIPRQKRKERPQSRAMKWSQIEFEEIGSVDPEKYKILKVDEQESDFQPENAPIKVPFIKPREPLTPYFLFLRQKRYMIAQSYPDLKENQMSETLGRVWKNLPSEDKEPYIREYKRSNQIYNRMLEQYYQMNPEDKSEMTKDAKKIQEAARISIARKLGKKQQQDKKSKKEDEPKKRGRKSKND